MPRCSGSTLTVKGTVGADVNTAQIEQRIVNPDLVGTAVGKRDIRAVPGRADPGAEGRLLLQPRVRRRHTFTATYVFDDPAVAAIAADGRLGERLMSWQVEDADGNRQGLTIAEFGEARRPRHGRLPRRAGRPGRRPRAATPPSARPTRPSSPSTGRPPTPAPGAAPVTGYSVEAIAPTVAGG